MTFDLHDYWEDSTGYYVIEFREVTCDESAFAYVNIDRLKKQIREILKIRESVINENARID